MKQWVENKAANYRGAALPRQFANTEYWRF